jgi:RHS repeat-associated protein
MLCRYTAVILVPTLFVTMPGTLAAGDSVGADQTEKQVHPDPVIASQAHYNTNIAKVAPPTGKLIFSSQPSDSEFFRNSPFQEPLIPIGEQTSVSENQALAAALTAFTNRKVQDDFSAIDAFLAQYPQSAWQISLLTNMGLIYRKTGWYSKSLDAWEKAWSLGKTETKPAAKAMVNRALAELISLNASLGRVERLEPLLAEIQNRTVSGSAGEKIDDARQGLAWMKKHPADGYRCGPLAVEAMRANAKKKIKFSLLIKTEPSSAKGTSLTQIYKLSNKIGLDLQMAKRSPGSAVITPAVIHWKVGHFAAAVANKNGLIQLHDPTFGGDVWVTQLALDSEADGYSLVKSGSLPSGWTSVEAAEGDTVWGKGPPSTSNPNDNAGPTPCTKPNGCNGSGANSSGGGGSSGTPQQSSNPPAPSPPSPSPTQPSSSPSTPPTSPGMASYSIYEMEASLSIQDTPVYYTPAYGPPVQFTISYSQREANQPSTFNYSNLGPLWTFSFLTYITDNPQNQQANVTQYLSGGGTLTYTYDTSISGFDPQIQNLGQLTRLSSSSYQLVLPDGSKQIFSAPGTGTTSRNVYLTQTVDPYGNTLTFNYDSTYRMTSVVDALGHATTISYESNNVNSLPAYYQIASVTEYYGRSATFTYDSNGNLSSSTDMIGMTSNFYYTNGVMSSMKTPYGTTTFNVGQNGLIRWVDVTDPMGGRERVETWVDGNPLPSLNQLTNVPAGTNNTYLMYRNTFHWTKKEWLAAPGDYNAAEITHWLHEPSVTTMSDVVESYKAPLENRVCYLYPNQTQGSWIMGSSTQPSATLQLLPDNSTTRGTYTTYNAQGNLLQSEDPFGRYMTYVYATNGIDLTDVYQGSSTSGDHIAHYTYYPNSHLVHVATDAAGQTTTYSYNMSTGQLLTVINANNETTTIGYNSGGFLTSITGPTLNSQAPSVSFAPGSYGLIGSFTDVNGYVRQFNYDSLERLTKVTYPDGTFDENVYNKLDVSQSKDRQNRWNNYFYNADDQLVSAVDGDNRITKFNRCICGALTGIIDPNGNLTAWSQDVEGRNATKTMADGSQYLYSYDALGRLQTMTDPKQQVATYSYNNDDRLLQVAYTNAAIPTATVSYVWDSIYPRIDSMTDGTGLTQYQYYPVGVLGAGNLETEASPLASSTITYAYDPLGRPTSANISDGFSSGVGYDSLGRINTATDQLGTFTYGYYGATARLQTVGNNQNGLNMSYSYQTGATQDFRLSDITNFATGTTVLSKFDYTYTAVGDIATWQKQADSSTPTLTTYNYDQADQLLGATTTNTSTQAVVSQYLYGYDPAANRNSEQIGLNVVSTTSNNLNQRTGSSSGGTLQVGGSLNKPGTVSVNGNPATVAGNDNFTATANTTTGTNVVTVVATNLNGYAVTNKWDVVVPANSSTTPLYDPNGNLINNGNGQTYAWDARNELTQITYTGGATTSFTYDGRGRRVAIIETSGGGTVTSTKQFVWLGNTMAEARNAANAVQERFYPQGEQISGTNYYFTRDHLGSIREMVNNAGALQARYDYDPYGRVTLISGTNLADFQYAGMYEHQPSGLNLTRGGSGGSTGRPYDPNTAKWLSRDPLKNAERREGPNLYEYVYNDPTRYNDPLGLGAGGDDGRGHHPKFNPPVPPPTGESRCPCGQHWGFSFSGFSDTVDTMTGGKAMASMFPEDANSSIHAGPVDAAADLNKALTYVPGLAQDANDLDPFFLGYGVAVDLGAFLGSWGCVPN